MESIGTRMPLLVAWVVVTSFYVWTATSDNVSWRFGEEQRDYYNLLVDGFLDGQLSLKADVAPELLAASNPYDPAQRPSGVALHDASLYGGRYYIYYGVVPAALLLLPFRVLTGIDLPLGAAVLMLGVTGYTFMLWMLSDLRRVYFPRTGSVVLGGLAVAIGLCSCIALLVRRASMYELPIASGFCFAMVAIFFAGRAIAGRGSLVGSLAMSSGCWGLAIGSRPTYVLAPALLLGVWLGLARSRPGGERGRWLAAVVLPAAVIGASLALYNYARFGDPLEFGVRYILSGVYEAQIEHFRPRYAAWNAYGYFLAASEWMRYFPFLQPTEITLPRPSQHLGMDIPFGLLRHVPFLAVAMLAPIAWRRQPADRRQSLLLIVGVIAWSAGSVLAVLLLFYAAMARYMADFAPALALLSAVATMGIAEALADRVVARRIFLAALGAVAGFSGLLVFLFSVAAYDRVRAFNPKAYAKLARVANAPVHWAETMARRGAEGALILRLEFPAHSAGLRDEELVRTGYAGETDRLVVSYPDDKHVQFSCEHRGAPRVTSEPVLLERGRELSLRIAFGSMFPLETHPAMASLPEEKRFGLTRRLWLEVDGRVVLHRYQRFHGASPGTLVIGGEGTEKFSGRLLDASRETLTEAVAHSTRVPLPATERLARGPQGGCIMAVQFPAGVAGRREPLIVSGESGRGNVLGVEYISADRVRFFFEHWGRQTYRGSVFEYEPGREYTMAVSHPLYSHAHANARVGQHPLVVAIDGRLIWSVTPLYYPAEGADLHLGHNPIGSTGAGDYFGGVVRQVFSPAPDGTRRMDENPL